ncbi:hypothetical protein GPAL_1623 [Glaciecola pallidula DSM 14239 = ACAM 615]|uniref:Uncharacterized protein n=1 Tax=Brumicola pallidula DSM 14239 = ACAM 615 TaxID=1121922 RepID=K6ZDS4_9ALTE|nr:hypothetical protein GPAL_1623 [Glaciecola pallidula DSM 14239 = ACAM 615]
MLVKVSNEFLVRFGTLIDLALINAMQTCDSYCSKLNIT